MRPIEFTEMMSNTTLEFQRRLLARDGLKTDAVVLFC